MDMTYLTGRSFSNLTHGAKHEDGNWIVTVTMTETLTYPNGTERTETITGSHKDPDFHEAHKNAMRDVLQYLQDLVYSRGFDSLIEGIDYQKGLEDESTIEIDEASPSE